MSDTKQVCFFVRSFPVLSETFVTNQIKDLVSQGVDVNVLAVNPIENENSEISEIFGAEVAQKVKSIFPKAHGMMSYLYMLFGMVFCLLSPKRFILIKLFFYFLNKNKIFLAKDLMCMSWFLRSKRMQFENCIAHFGNNGVIFDHLVQAGLIKCGNLFTIFHGYEISRYDQLNIWEGLYSKMGGTLLPISNYWKKKLISLGVASSKIEVIHMGVNIDEFSYRESPVTSPLSILSVARATEKKGLIYAIEAVLNCPVECEYRIIGDGVLLESLKENTFKHPNRHRVIFEGAKPPNFVKESLKRTDLFLLPSITDRWGDMEGIPVSLMEAMASGVLVLSTYHSGIPELITDNHNGFLVSERDSDSITKKIIEVSDYSSLNDIRRAARKTIEDEFNAQKLSEKLQQLL